MSERRSAPKLLSGLTVGALGLASLGFTGCGHASGEARGSLGVRPVASAEAGASPSPDEYSPSPSLAPSSPAATREAQGPVQCTTDDFNSWADFTKLTDHARIVRIARTLHVDVGQVEAGMLGQAQCQPAIEDPLHNIDTVRVDEVTDGTHQPERICLALTPVTTDGYTWMVGCVSEAPTVGEP